VTLKLEHKCTRRWTFQNFAGPGVDLPLSHLGSATATLSNSISLFFSVLALVLTYLYLTLVRGEPWYLSQATRDTVQFYSLHAAVMALQKLGLVSC
jgi:hypothetical protein